MQLLEGLLKERVPTTSVQSSPPDQNEEEVKLSKDTGVGEQKEGAVNGTARNVTEDTQILQNPEEEGKEGVERLRGCKIDSIPLLEVKRSKVYL